MWPQALQMTRDECRGILRRLELESYSQVISVFRAQGGLSDAKAKLLEELRGIFHISNERHRAEARRVANDEQLATIAEAISGPNTWQEWSREGRRPYPMLPRVAPQTALALIANNVAEETANENSKLPYPAETAEAIKEDQLQIENQKSMEAVERNFYVITNDPFKIPEIPTNNKKNLKRNMNSEQHNSGMGKKRTINDNSAHKNYTTSGGQKQYPHITANSPLTGNITAASTTSPTNVSERKQKQKQAADEQYILKQRFFHQQHQMTKQKMAKKAAAAAALGGGGGGSTKRQATPAKSGRRANQKMLMEQQKQQMAMKQLQIDMQQQQQESIPMQIDLTGTTTTTSAAQAQAILTQQQLDMQFVTYAQQHQPPQQIFMEKDIFIDAHQTHQPTLTAAASSQQQHLPSLITPLSSPQIAASKRDISKNLNKLQMQQQQQQTHLTSSSNVSSTTSSVQPSATATPSLDLHTSLGNILSTSASIKSTEKSLISTTPVQKYIVEERQPGLALNLPTPAPGSIINIQNPSSGSLSSSATATTHIIQVSSAGQHQAQIMTLPQFSAAATKLRAVNTTLIAPGAKISSTTTKKLSNAASAGGGVGHTPLNAGALHELANVASTQSQVLHIVEAAQGSSANNSQNATHVTPLHTPPAVIQIQNASVGVATSSTSPDISLASSQSKVLTTKILPLILTGTGNQNSTNTSLINNSSLIVASSPTTPMSTSSTQPTIIKNLPGTMLLNTSTANLTPVTVTTNTHNTIISTLGAGATVFRKPPNILKTSQSAATTPTKSSSITSPSSTSTSSTPHIISNIKLTPVSVSSSANTGTHLTHTTNSFKTVIPSTSGMVRTSVKICQSPNGKVFIQPAGLVDATKMKLNTNSSVVTHKIISNTSSANATSSSSGGGQRIAIQKVQIIPAPMGSPAGVTTAGGTTLQPVSHHHQLNTKPTTLTGKSNMIFMPTSTTNVRPVTLSKMGNNILLKSSSNQHLTTTNTTTIAAAAADNTNIKSNIVVLGPSSSQATKEQISSSSSQMLKLESNQLINEDTPLDILNMPIVMEEGVCDGSSSVAETVTLLQSNIIDTSNTSGSTSNNAAATSATSIILEQSSLQPTQTVILEATDWEMELDQAITTAAHNIQHAVMATQQNTTIKKTNHKLKRTISSSSSTSAGNITSSSSSTTTTTTTPSSHKQKRLNNDLISIEVKAKESNSSPIYNATNYTTSSNASNNMIVVDDSFDDVIVEEHEDDATTSSNKQHDHHDDTPKILDMQIYQQHDGHDNKIAQILSNNTTQLSSHQSQDQEVSSMDSSEQVQQQQHHHPQQQHECEIDAGFDETIVTEIDENTAIEYIEEDITPNVSTMTTKLISNKNIIPLTTSTGARAADKTEKQDVTKTGKILDNSNNHLTSSTTGETSTAASTTISNESITNEITTANISATQQVEP